MRSYYYWLCGLLVTAGCSQATEQPSSSDEPGTEIQVPAPVADEPGSNIGEGAAGLRKELGGVNGAGDYCNFSSAASCVNGEGDCDSNAECTGVGNICGLDRGGAFGMDQRNEVCIPATCNNGALDPGEGPEADCGGACGNTCACAATLPSPHSDRCTYGCRCGAGLGDCDADNNCTAGNVCVNDVGARIGGTPDMDVCFPAHCRDRVQNNGETVIDGGGPCGAVVCPGVNGDGYFCTPSCQCGDGEGDCDTNLDCEAGLVCKEEGAVDRCRPAVGPAGQPFLVDFDPGNQNDIFNGPTVLEGLRFVNGAGEEQHFHSILSSAFPAEMPNNGTNVLLNDRDTRQFVTVAFPGFTRMKINSIGLGSSRATQVTVQGFLGGAPTGPAQVFPVPPQSTATFNVVSLASFGIVDTMVFDGQGDNGETGNGPGGFALDNISGELF